MGELERAPHELKLLVDMVDRPATTLSTVAAHPRWRWLLPVAMLLAAAIASVVLTGALTTGQTQDIVQQQLAMLPADQAATVQGVLDRFQQPPVVLAMAIGGRLAGLLLGLLMALVIIYFAAVIAGADMHLNVLIATLPWTWLPFALRDAVQTAYVLYRGKLMANTGLSYFVSSGKPTDDALSLQYNALKNVDLFAVWHLVLVFVLFLALPRFGRFKAFVLTLVYAALSLGVRLVPVLLGRNLLPG